MSDGELILVVGALLVAALGASLAASRLRVPALLLFLGIGMAVGSDGAAWIQFDDYSLSPPSNRISASAIAPIRRRAERLVQGAAGRDGPGAPPRVRRHHH